MNSENRNPALGAAAGFPELSSFRDDDTQDTAPKPGATQGEISNPRVVFEVSQDDILAKEIELLGGVMAHAQIAQDYAAIGDARGFLYSLDKTVEHAIRAGDEGVALRKLRERYRKSASLWEASQ